MCDFFLTSLQQSTNVPHKEWHCHLQRRFKSSDSESLTASHGGRGQTGQVLRWTDQRASLETGSLFPDGQRHHSTPSSHEFCTYLSLEGLVEPKTQSHFWGGDKNVGLHAFQVNSFSSNFPMFLLFLFFFFCFSHVSSKNTCTFTEKSTRCMSRQSLGIQEWHLIMQLWNFLTSYKN